MWSIAAALLGVAAEEGFDALEGPPPPSVSVTEAVVGGFAIAGLAAGATWCLMSDCLDRDAATEAAQEDN